MIFNRDTERAGRGVAAGRGDLNRVGGRSLRESRAAGQTGSLRGALAGAIVAANRGNVSPHRRALTGIGVLGDVGRAGDGRVFMIFNRDTERAGRRVAAGDRKSVG